MDYKILNATNFPVSKNLIIGLGRQFNKLEYFFCIYQIQSLELGRPPSTTRKDSHPSLKPNREGTSLRMPYQNKYDITNFIDALKD